jgi:hypothetical protein
VASQERDRSLEADENCDPTRGLGELVIRISSLDILYINERLETPSTLRDLELNVAHHRNNKAKKHPKKESRSEILRDIHCHFLTYGLGQIVVTATNLVASNRAIFAREFDELRSVLLVLVITDKTLTKHSLFLCNQNRSSHHLRRRIPLSDPLRAPRQRS